MNIPRATSVIFSSVVVFALSALFGCDGVRTVSDRDVELMPVSKLRELMAKQSKSPNKAELLLLDARPSDEYEVSRLPAARQIPLNRVPINTDRGAWIERFDYVVIYGEHPSSAPAKALAKRMMSRKFGDIYVYDGGVADWQSRGFELEAGPSQSTDAGDGLGE